MSNNNMKKFLRMLGIVWSVALTILVFAVLLLKIELVLEILTSTPVIAVICIVFGLAAGFIAGTIVCFLKTSKVIEEKEGIIAVLKNSNKSLNMLYKQSQRTLNSIYEEQAQEQENVNANRGNHIMSAIENFDSDYNDPVEENQSDTPSPQGEDFKEVEPPIESET